MKTVEYVNSIFEQPWWFETVVPGEWKEIMIKNGNQVEARYIYYLHNNKITMPKLTQSVGVWIRDIEGKGVREQLQHNKEMLHEILAELPKVTSISVSLDSNNEYFLPFYWNNFSVSPRISYRIEELNDLDAVLYNFSKNIRRDIKNAQKKLHISYEPSSDILYNIMSKTFKEQNRKYPIEKELIDRILTNSLKHNAGRMITALDDNNNVHAAAFFLYDANRCYYLIGGKNAEYKNTNAPTLLLWEGIQMAASVSKVFDFEGSMIEGIESFFQRFGGKPVVYYNVNKLSWFDSLKYSLKPSIKRLMGYKV